jgi:hypothetical protein
MPVKNEDWILGLSARVALTWCDELVILDNGSTDRSVELARDLYAETNRVSFIFRVGQWDEMPHRQMMLEEARHRGATHIALIDADEILTGNLFDLWGPFDFVAPSQVRFWIETMEPGMMLQLPLYNMRGGMYRYHSNGLWGGGLMTLAFKDEPKLHWKGDRFHHREPMGRRWEGFQPVAHGEGGVMHLWGASEARLLAKHALYKVTERLRWPQKDVREIDRYYSMCVDGQTKGEAAGWTFATAPASWWAPYAGWMKYLDFSGIFTPGGLPVKTGPEPWQTAEVRRLVAEHGHERFAGLDLFGVDK